MRLLLVILLGATVMWLYALAAFLLVLAGGIDMEEDWRPYDWPHMRRSLRVVAACTVVVSVCLVLAIVKVAV